MFTMPSAYGGDGGSGGLFALDPELMAHEIGR